MKNVNEDTEERIMVRKLVQKAIKLFQSAGKQAVLAQISNPGGMFVQGDRYVFALDERGAMLAHPFETELRGRIVIDLKDSDGKPFIEKIVVSAKTRGEGFIDYKWPHPESEKELSKTVFFEKIGGIIFCSGFYSSHEEL